MTAAADSVADIKQGVSPVEPLFRTPFRPEVWTARGSGTDLRGP
jgi:hypothetical protein